MNDVNDYNQEAAVRQARAETTCIELQSLHNLHAIPMVIDGLSESHLLKTSWREAPINLSGKIAINPGRLVCILGDHGSGKSTLLKLIAGILPLEDVRCVFVPSHIRMLHVTEETVFLHNTLLHNLTLGVHVDLTPENIRTICKRLGLSESVLQYLDSDHRCDWDEVLSHTECHLLSIARALIANYELLVIHRPCSGLSDAVKSKVMTLLREFVVERGLGLDPSTWHQRTPRTCIMSTVRWGGVARHCDAIFFVDPIRGISEMSHASLAEKVTLRHSLSGVPSPLEVADPPNGRIEIHL